MDNLSEQSVRSTTQREPGRLLLRRVGFDERFDRVEEKRRNKSVPRRRLETETGLKVDTFDLAQVETLHSDEVESEEGEISGG